MIEAVLSGRTWQLTENPGPYRRLLDIDGLSDVTRLRRFLLEVVETADEHERGEWELLWRRSTMSSPETLMAVIDAIIERAAHMKPAAFARLATFLFQEQTWRQVRGDLLTRGMKIEELDLGDLLDVGWASISTSYSGWDSPIEFRETLYQWFFNGVEPKKKADAKAGAKAAPAPTKVSSAEIVKMKKMAEQIRSMTGRDVTG